MEGVGFGRGKPETTKLKKKLAGWLSKREWPCFKRRRKPPSLNYTASSRAMDAAVVDLEEAEVSSSKQSNEPEEEEEASFSKQSSEPEEAEEASSSKQSSEPEEEEEDLEENRKPQVVEMI